MALKCWDGYDHYNSITDFEQRSGFIQYQRPVGGASYSFVTGRNGFGKAFQFSAFYSGTSHGLYCSYGGSRNPDNFFGMAIKQGSNVGMIFTFFDSITLEAQCSAFFNPTNYAVQFYRGAYLPSGGGTFLGASLNNVWFPGTWNYFELWPVVSSGAGGLKVYFNNNLICNITGVNSQVTSNAWWDQWELVGATNGDTITIDDHYVADTAVGLGLAPANTPIGDSKVSTLWATGDNSVQWSPKDIGQPNYSEIDEIAMDSDTSYNYTTTPTNRDMFSFQSLPAGVATVYGVQLTGAYRKDDALVRTIQQLIQSGATVDTTASTHNVPDAAYAYFSDLFILNPDTVLNWTVAEVNGMAAGYQLVA